MKIEPFKNSTKKEIYNFLSAFLFCLCPDFIKIMRAHICTLKAVSTLEQNILLYLIFWVHLCARKKNHCLQKKLLHVPYAPFTSIITHSLDQCFLVLIINSFSPKLIYLS